MEAYIVIFLLLFAVLAFGWFYFQRAKSRAAAPDASAASVAAAPSAPPAAEPEAPRTDHTAS